MLSLHLTRQHPVASHSRQAMDLQVTSGRAWITQEQCAAPDAVLSTGDVLHLAPGARVFASGLPLATLALYAPAETAPGQAPLHTQVQP